MRVVVIGATGNVGTAVVEALGADDRVEEIVGLARRLPERSFPKTRFAVADIAADDLRPHLAGADAVVHLAWLFQPTHDPVLTWKVNAVGSTRVFEAAADANVDALVYASSVGAYSPGPDRDRDFRVDESWPTHSLPTAGYGREKAYVERALDAFEARHPETRVVRLRPGFIFQRSSASEQRRLFLGPLVPHIRPSLLPILPLPAGLRFQALHASDVADAYRLAVVGDARGAFNVAADPVVDRAVLGDLLDARTFEVPAGPVRGALAAAWHLRLVPAAPALLDLVLAMPLMDTTRARTELGWTPRYTGVEAVREFLTGFAEGAGDQTAPLAANSAASRWHEVDTGVGGRP